MKKSIFDLSFDEGASIDLKVRKTSFYRQYVKSYIASVVILLLMFVPIIIELHSESNGNTAMAIALTIMAGFLSLIILLFSFKRFDLIKQYYELKKDTDIKEKK